MSLKKKERAVLKAAIEFARGRMFYRGADEGRLLDAVTELEAELGLGDEGDKNNAWYYTEPNDDEAE